MSENNKNNNHVRWNVFVFVITLILMAFGWFGQRIDSKLNVLGDRLHEIDKTQAVLEQRTKLLEGLDSNQINMIKNGILRALNK